LEKNVLKSKFDLFFSFQKKFCQIIDLTKLKKKKKKKKKKNLNIWFQVFENVHRTGGSHERNSKQPMVHQGTFFDLFL